MSHKAVLMLRHLKETQAADRIEQALYKVLQEGKIRTYDLSPDPSPKEGGEFPLPL